MATSARTRMLNSLSSGDHVRASRLAALAVCALAGLICLWLLVRVAWLLMSPGDVALGDPNSRGT